MVIAINHYVGITLLLTFSSEREGRACFSRRHQYQVRRLPVRPPVITPPMLG